MRLANRFQLFIGIRQPVLRELPEDLPTQSSQLRLFLLQRREQLFARLGAPLEVGRSNTH
jgi:hypothetical protein